VGTANEPEPVTRLQSIELFMADDVALGVESPRVAITPCLRPPSSSRSSRKRHTITQVLLIAVLFLVGPGVVFSDPNAAFTCPPVTIALYVLAFLADVVGFLMKDHTFKQAATTIIAQP
jgi:protein-S-isoprenylcysteine O-methyltransferase Ste14